MGSADTPHFTMAGRHPSKALAEAAARPGPGTYDPEQPGRAQRPGARIVAPVGRPRAAQDPGPGPAYRVPSVFEPVAPRRPPPAARRPPPAARPPRAERARAAQGSLFARSHGFTIETRTAIDYERVVPPPPYCCPYPCPYCTDVPTTIDYEQVASSRDAAPPRSLAPRAAEARGLAVARARGVRPAEAARRPGLDHGRDEGAPGVRAPPANRAFSRDETACWYWRGR
jgi:hypothetical protein